MGKSKEMFSEMREEEATINTTFKISKSCVLDFEKELREIVRVVDFRIVSNTEQLYKKDPYFRKLVKHKMKVTNDVLDYINKYNN